MRKHKYLKSIVCNNSHVREFFYNSGILEKGYMFSLNGIGDYVCSGDTFSECYDEINKFLKEDEK